MSLSLSEEQRAIQRTFHAFAEREIRPLAADLDNNPRFPKEIFARAAEIGLFGMRYPEPIGNGADVTSYVLAIEELAWGSLAVAATCAMQSLMGTFLLHKLGSSEIHERLLEPAIRGDKIGTICMTEPGAGTDLGSIATTAKHDGGRYFLSGQKTWITSAPVADFFTVFARTEDGQLSTFLVERDAAGLEVGRAIDKLGVRASLTSEVFFENTPATCMLGEQGKGGGALKEILAEVRLMTAALALGVGRAALEDATAYANEREQFGRAISKFQAIRFHLAEMAVDLEAARRLTYWAAWRSDQGMPNATEASMAKLFASEAAARICERAARVTASYGYASDSNIQRYLRDVRFTLIGGGTSEILKVSIGKAVAGG